MSRAVKIVTVDEMRGLEAESEARGVSTDTLMERAGLAAAVQARKHLAKHMVGVAGSRVLVLVGPGNNGGDGLVAAGHLRRWGAKVTAYLVVPGQREHPKLPPALDRGVALVSSPDDPGLELLAGELSRCHLAIDAVLGTGRARPLEGTVREAMLRLDAARERRPAMAVMALDVPTGMDADTGQVDPACPRADVTVAFGYPKAGHFQFPGAAMSGVLEVVDIGVPDGLADGIELELLTPEWVRETLPRRPLDSHKGTFGHALVVAGSRSYVGAAYLASQGAARVGPGLVTLASPQGIYPMLASKLTEVIHQPVPEDDAGRFSPEAAGVLAPALRSYTSLLVGCGFGRSPGLEELLRLLLLDDSHPTLPAVIDADGLNNLSRIEGWWRDLRRPAVLTPHPGEMSTLTGLPTSDIQSRRVEVAREWAARWGQAVVLKGAFTLIASPDGMCRVSPFANPGLASGGTGDVLTGVIAGLMAQGLSPQDAACCGVYVHGLSAQMVGAGMGDAGTLAGDLLDALPRAIRSVRES